MIAPVRLPLAEWCRRYCAQRDLSAGGAYTYRHAVARFEKWFGQPASVRELASRLNEFIGELSQANRHSAKSIRSRLVTLLRAAAANGLVRPLETIRPVKLPEHRPDAMQPDEMTRLLAHASPHQRAAILLAYDTGLRRGDLFRATWRDLALPRAILTLVAAKSGRLVTRRLRAATVAALEEIRSPSNEKLLRSPTPKQWRERWRELGKRAGVVTKNRGLQAIRRTGATLSKRAGYSASDYLGHSANSRGVAERYYLDPRLLDEAPPLPPEIG